MAFSEDQKAFIRETVREVLNETSADTAAKIIAGINEHRLKCEAKAALANLQRDWDSVKGKTGGVLLTIGAVGGAIAFLVSTAVAVWASLKH